MYQLLLDLLKTRLEVERSLVLHVSFAKPSEPNKSKITWPIHVGKGKDSKVLTPILKVTPLLFFAVPSIFFYIRFISFLLGRMFLSVVRTKQTEESLTLIDTRLPLFLTSSRYRFLFLFFSLLFFFINHWERLPLSIIPTPFLWGSHSPAYRFAPTRNLGAVVHLCSRSNSSS